MNNFNASALSSRASSFALATVFTLVMLVSVNSLARVDARSTQAAAQLAQHTQQVAHKG